MGRRAEGVLSVAPDGAVLWADPSALAILGLDEDACFGRPLAELYVDGPAVEDILSRIGSGGEGDAHRTELRGGYGGTKQVLLTCRGVRRAGTLLHVLCFVRDLTAMGGTEIDRALLAAIVAGSDDAIVSKNLDGIITSWNEGAERLFGYGASEVIGRPVTVLIPADRSDEEPKIMARIRAGERVAPYETVRRRKDGTRVEVSLSVSPVVDSTGHIVGASKIARDVTIRKRTERRLRAAEKRYRGLAELLPVGICACDAPSGIITYYNGQAGALWGRTPKLGHPDERYSGALKLLRPDSGEVIPMAESPPAIALREGRRFRSEEVVIERPDGSRVTVLSHVEPVRGRDGEVLGVIEAIHDVTAMKESEAALRTQKEEVQALLDMVPVTVFIAEDPECKRISGNANAAHLLQLPANASFSLSAPSDEAPPFRILRDGEPIPTERLPIQRAAGGQIVENEPFDIELVDGTLLHTLISAQPLYDEMGSPRGAIASILDVTELTRSENALREADRRKNEFLATLSHELRNPLAPILTGLEILRMVDDPEVYERTLRTMERQTRQMVRLVDDLLDVSRLTRDSLELRPEQVELAEVVKDAVDTARPWIGKGNHTLTVDLPDHPVPLEADGGRISQVVSNLLINAAVFTPEGGTITLSGKQEGGEIVIRVEDTGVGIPEDQQTRIFEMFSEGARSHERGHMGLGIGLSLARSLVEMHLGSLTVASAGTGQGSTFTVRMPTHSSIAQEHRAPASTERPAETVGSPRRVLVVDDNEAFVDALKVVIEALGHEVCTACDGEGALEVAAEYRPDVVLMDLGMPGLNGYEAARLIRMQPWGRDLLLVALTGWGQREDKERTREAGFDHHIVKPARAAELRRLLAS